MPDRIENGSTSVLDILNNLTYSELSQYSVGGADDGGISETNYPKIMSAINRAVNQIQKDLSLNENTVRIIMVEGILTYPIHSKYSLTNGTEPILFVDDSIFAPFENDILRIRQIYNKEGRELPINTRNNIDSVYVPQHNVVQVPYPKTGDVLGVVYSRFTQPTVTTQDEAQVTYLPIPDYTLDALYAYVAAKMTAGITTEQEISDSQVWMREYETQIAKIQHSPSIQEGREENTKLTDNGFV